MKKLRFLAALALVSASYAFGNRGYASFHNPRTLQEGFASYGDFTDNGMQALALFSHTYDAKNQAKRYLPVDANEMRLSEWGAGDINPAWLNLTGKVATANNSLQLGRYESVVSLKPYRWYVGALLHGAWKINDNLKVNLYTGLAHTAAGVTISEKGGNDGTFEEIKNFKNAMMDQKDFMKYGRMSEKETKTGVDDLRVELMYVQPWDNTVFDSCVHEMGMSVKVPSSKAPDATHFVAPRVGTNHFGLGGVYNCQLAWGDWTAKIDGQAQYMFGAKEMRSFDFAHNGPWSRYLKVTKETGVLGNEISAINITTREATVTPRLSASVGAKAAWHNDNHTMQFGYRCFIRLKEKISRVDAITPGYGIRNVDRNVPGGLRGSSMRWAKINQGGIASYAVAKETNFIELTTADLDFDSAATPAWVSSLLDARYIYTHNEIGMNVGVQAEVAHINAFPSLTGYMGVSCEF